MVRLYRLSLEDACGSGWQTSIHPDDAARVIDYWRSLLESGQPGEFEIRLRRFDGAFRWFLIRAVPLRDETGKIFKWYGQNTDIEELKQSEACKAAILDSALDCIVTIDHEGRITEFNPAAERTFGYRRDEVVGKELADVIIPPSLREQHRRGFARYLTTGDAQVLGKRVEMTAVRADRSEFPVELAITRITLGLGQALRARPIRSHHVRAPGSVHRMDCKNRTHPH